MRRSVRSAFIFDGARVGLPDGVRRKRRKKPAADAPAIQTRQEFYYEVYRKILNDEILRGVYLPSRTRSGAADLLCGENLYEPGTYRYRVYARKKRIGFTNDGGNAEIWLCG